MDLTEYELYFDPYPLDERSDTMLKNLLSKAVEDSVEEYEGKIPYSSDEHCSFREGEEGREHTCEYYLIMESSIVSRGEETYFKSTDPRKLVMEEDNILMRLRQKLGTWIEADFLNENGFYVIILDVSTRSQISTAFREAREDYAGGYIEEDFADVSSEIIVTIKFRIVERRFHLTKRSRR